MPQEIKKMKPKKALDSAENRLRTAAIVVLLCVALVVGVVLAVTSGKGRKSGSITAQTTSGQAQSQPTGTNAATVESIQVPPLSVYRRRNIFKPLVNMEPVVTSTSPTAPGSGGSLGAGGASIITMPPELDPSGQEVGSVVSTALTLEGVFEQGGNLFARIRIGDSLFEKVAVGEVFADNYKLLTLGKDSSATILYGDERFTIFAGQSLYW